MKEIIELILILPLLCTNSTKCQILPNLLFIVTNCRSFVVDQHLIKNFLNFDVDAIFLLITHKQAMSLRWMMLGCSVVWLLKLSFRNK